MSNIDVIPYDSKIEIAAMPDYPRMPENRKSQSRGRRILLATMAATAAAVGCAVVMKLLTGEINAAVTGGVAGAVGAITMATGKST